MTGPQTYSTAMGVNETVRLRPTIDAPFGKALIEA
jgi:hypothetical protein